MSSLQNPMQAFDGLPIRQAVFRQIFPAVASQMITPHLQPGGHLLCGPAQPAQPNCRHYGGLLPLPDAHRHLQPLWGRRRQRPGPGFGPQGPGQGPGDCRHLLLVGGGGQLGVLCPVLGVCHPILSLCGATADTLPIALGYAKWVVVIGGPATILNTLLANLIRAEGKAGGRPPSACPWAASPTWCWTPVHPAPVPGPGGSGRRHRHLSVQRAVGGLLPSLPGAPAERERHRPAPPCTSATAESTWGTS